MQSLLKLFSLASRRTFICNRCYRAICHPLSGIQTSFTNAQHSENIMKTRNDGVNLFWNVHLSTGIRTFCNDIQEDEKSTPQKRQKKEYPPNTLYIDFKEIATTNEDIRAMTTQMKSYKLWKNNSGKGSFALITFNDEKTMEEHCDKWIKEGYHVEKAGQRKQYKKEHPPNTLFIEFNEIGTTNEDIRAMTTQMKSYMLRRKDSGQSYAFITFNDEKAMEEHCEKWRKKGYHVEKHGQRKQYVAEAAPRTLRIYFKETNITEEDMYCLSDDIRRVRMKVNPFISSVAYLEFGSEAEAVTNLKMFEKKGIQVDHMKIVLKRDKSYPQREPVVQGIKPQTIENPKPAENTQISERPQIITEKLNTAEVYAEDQE